MSVKIIKRKKIRNWLEETMRLINITLEGKVMPLDLTKLPDQLKENISVHVSTNNIDPRVKRLKELLRYI